MVGNLTYLIFLNETDEGSPLDLHGLPGAVVQGHYEVEEVTLAQVAGRLLLEVRSPYAYAAVEMKKVSNEKNVSNKKQGE